MPRALSFDDARWQSLAGGYRILYDPRPALRRLAADFGDEAAWKELWGELHHQGDVGDASYAALPSLVDLGERAAARDENFYALAATIEVERHRHANPELPAWLAPLYTEAWEALVRLALSDLARGTDPLVVQSALAVVALGRGALRLGALLAHLDPSEIEEYLDERAAWDELYDEGKRLRRGS
jgi:hypothetical protein